jgi:hypothetical protein
MGEGVVEIASLGSRRHGGRGFSSNNHRDSESAEKIMGRSPEDSKLGEAGL